MKHLPFKTFLILLTITLLSVVSLNAQEKSTQPTFQEESLFYAGKVWGFVKYYHPEARVGKFDMDSLLVVLLDKSAETKTLKERNAVLNGWVSQFGKIKEFEKFIIKDSSQYKQLYDYSWLTNSSFDKKLSKQLLDIKDAKRTDSCYYAAVVSQSITPSFNNEKATNIDFSKPFQKFIPFLRYWNVIEYYFPYKYLTDKKWDSVLREYISVFKKVENEYEFNTATRFLIAEINDGHSHFKNYGINMKHPVKRYFSPIELIYSKDKFIVKRLMPYFKTTDNISDYGLEIGDEIISVNGIEPNVFMRGEIAKYWGASNFEHLCYSNYHALLQSDTTFVEVSYKRDRNVLKNRVKTGMYEYKEPAHTNKEPFKITSDSICYISFAGIPEKKTYEVIAKIQDTKGLIIDIRNYPDSGLPYILTSLLAPNRIKYANYSIIKSDQPGVFVSHNSASTFFGIYNPVYYKGRIIIIIDSATMSAAEGIAMRLQKLPNVTTIGSRTAGADGNTAYIDLTNKISVGFSSLGVYYPDGRETQRVGLRLDEEVYPTPLGIKEGRDEVVERAMEIIRQNIKINRDIATYN